MLFQKKKNLPIYLSISPILIKKFMPPSPSNRCLCTECFSSLWALRSPARTAVRLQQRQCQVPNMIRDINVIYMALAFGYHLTVMCSSWAETSWRQGGGCTGRLSDRKTIVFVFVFFPQSKINLNSFICVSTNKFENLIIYLIFFFPPFGFGEKHVLINFCEKSTNP